MAKKKLKDQLSNVDNQNINKAATPKESGGLSPTTLPTLGSEDNNTPRALYGTRPEGNELGLQNKPGGDIEMDTMKPIVEEDVAGGGYSPLGQEGNVAKAPDLNMYDDNGNVVGQRSQEAADYLASQGNIEPETGEVKLVDDIFGSDQWGKNEMGIYNNMSAEEKSELKLITDQAKQDRTDAVKAQVEYIQKVGEEKAYRESQQDKRNEINELTGEVAQINASARIRGAQKQLDNLKNNLAYLGTMGRPGTSAKKLDAVADQLKEANRTFQDMVSVENKMVRARNIGNYAQAEQFERQLELLQDDLDSKVNDTVQNAYNQFSAAEAGGSLDDEDTFDTFATNLLTKLDEDLSGLIGVNYEQRKYLIDTANKRKEDEETYRVNAKKRELDPVTNTYIDGNGNTVLDASGSPIIAPNKPDSTFMNEETGEFVAIYQNDDGTFYANKTKLFDAPKFEQNVIAGLAAKVAAGTMTMAEVAAMDKNILTNPAFQKAIAAAEFKQPTTDTQDWSISGGVMYNKRTGETKNVSATESVGGGWQKLDEETLYNKNTGEFKNRGTEDEYKGKKYNSTTEEVKQNGLDEFITNNATGTAGGQCGAFANDYLQSIGVGRIFTDPITQKKAQINSDSPTVGSVAIMDSPIAPEYGHVVVVTGINDDGTINVIESNMSGNETISERTMKTDNISGYFDPSISYEQAKEGTTGAATEGMQFKDELIPMYKEFYKSGKLTSTTIKSIEKTQTMEEFYKEALEYSKSNITGHYDKAKEIKDKAEKLKGLGRLARMGSTLPGSNLIPGLADLDAAFDTFKSQLSLKNLVDLKSEGATFGALSDNELQFITDAATALRRDLSDDKWESELEYIIDKMDKVVSKAETDMEEYGMIEKQKGRERFGYDGSKSGTLPTGNETAEPQSEDYDAIFESDNMDLESDGR